MLVLLFSVDGYFTKIFLIRCLTEFKSCLWFDPNLFEKIMQLI